MGEMFLVCGIFVSAFVSSQTRINYALKITHPDKDERLYNMNLDVEAGTTYFYDEKLLANSKSTSKSNQFLIHQNTKEENVQIVYSAENKPYKISSKDKITWKLENEFKEIDHYKLQKATANFGERTWTAWFCPDVNITEGPYKFRDLPGLIFELRDSENIFVYQLTKIEKFKAETKKLSFDVTKIQDISTEKYDKMMGDFFENPFLKQRSQLTNGVELNVDDRDVQVQDLNKMTAEFKKNIKNTYPPAVEINQFKFYKEQILN